MKIKILSLAVLGGLSALIYNGVRLNVEDVSNTQYPTEDISISEYSAKGAAEHWSMVRGSQEDGQVHKEDYDAVMAQISAKKSSRADGIGLEFEPLGPTNIGGRTRSLVVDNDDPNRLYAAGVTGGVFLSVNGGNTWTTTFDTSITLTNSWMAQGSDGVLYLATGAATFEGEFSRLGGTPDGPGIGIMKSTDRGVSWKVIPSTEVISGVQEDFENIDEIKVSPVNPKVIAVATKSGLLLSFDGGDSWVKDLVCDVNSNPTAFHYQTVEFSKDGDKLWAGTSNGAFYYLDDVNASNTCGFVQVPDTDGFPLGARRLKIRRSVLNNDKVYVVLTTRGGFLDLVESIDGGETFQPVNPNVPKTDPDFDLFAEGARPGNGQAWYDLLFMVVPNSKDTSKENIWLGGVDLWRFDGNWTQAAVGGRANGRHNPFFVHVDHHIMTYQKDNPSVLYFGNDGGVFKSIDGGYEFYDVNKGYMTTQFYSIAIANFDYAVGGTQDNGCIMVSPLRPGDSDFGAVVFNENVTNGDGFDCVVSNIVDLKYTSAQNNSVGRGLITSPKGSGSCAPYCDDPNYFYTKLALWESTEDTSSQLFIEFKSEVVADAVDLGTGIRKTFTGSIVPEHSAAIVDLNSVSVGTVDDRLVYNGNGAFTGAGSGSFDTATMQFSVTFNTPPPLNAKVNVYYAASYKAGSVITVGSNTAQIPIQHILNASMEPGDVEFIQDPVQSLLAMPVTTECLESEAASSPTDPCSGRANGIVLTRNAINTSAEIDWIFMPIGGAYRMIFTPDGDVMFKTNGSQIARISGISDVYSQEDADKYDANANNKQTFINGFAGFITNVNLHPNDPETLIVTTGNYGITRDHVYLVTGALGPNPTVIPAGGDLPYFPVYDAIFDVTNPERVILGTDKGVWTCSDIWAANPEYVEENGTIGNFHVVDVDQQTLPHGKASNREVIYLGTHGRGIWKSGSVVTSVGPELNEVAIWEPQIKMFPNPVSSNLQIEYTINNPSEVSMQIYSLSGNVVKTITPSALKGENSINVPVNDLPSGAYFINLRDGNNQKSAKFIKM